MTILSIGMIFNIKWFYLQMRKYRIAKIIFIVILALQPAYSGKANTLINENTTLGKNPYES